MQYKVRSARCTPWTRSAGQGRAGHLGNSLDHTLNTRLYAGLAKSTGDKELDEAIKKLHQEISKIAKERDGVLDFSKVGWLLF